MWRRFAPALFVLLLAGTVGAVGPGVARACACSAYVVDERLETTHETALVELSGQSQAITVNIGAETVASNAAFLMPGPSRTEFEMESA